MRLGVTLPQFTGDPGVFADGARRAEDEGFDSAWVFDHLWPLGARKRPILEGWSALAYLASATRRISIGTLVTRSTLRPPAVLAHMADTVADQAPGRVVVAVGSGDELSRPENEAFGLPYHSGRRRTEQLVATLRALVDHRGAKGGPSVWAAGWSASTLAAAGGFCDGWNGWMEGPERFERAVESIREAAAGRRVELTWGAQVIVGRTREDAEARLGARDPRHYVHGGPDEVAAHIGTFAKAGCDHVIAALPDAADPAAWRALAAALAPLRS